MSEFVQDELPFGSDTPSQSVEEWLSTPHELGVSEPVEDVGGGVGILSSGAPPSDWADLAQQVEIRAVILRACSHCGAKSQLDDNGVAVCSAGCGQAEAIDVGVVDANYKGSTHPLKKIAWTLYGKNAASRRIKAANKKAE